MASSWVTLGITQVEKQSNRRTACEKQGRLGTKIGSAGRLFGRGENGLVGIKNDLVNADWRSQVKGSVRTIGENFA